MNIESWQSKLLFITIPFIPAAFGAGYQFHKWTIEKVNVDVVVKNSYIPINEISKNYISKKDVAEKYLDKKYVTQNYIKKQNTNLY